MPRPCWSGIRTGPRQFFGAASSGTCWVDTLRRQALTFDEARTLQAEAESLLAGSEHEVDSERVLELVRDSDCSAYDCEFVALAMRLGVKLVTMDAKLLKAFPRQAVALTAGRRSR